MILSKMPGTPLPKRLLRPFKYYEGFKLDNKQYVLVAGNDKKILLAFPGVVFAVITFGAILGWSATKDSTALYIGLTAFIISILFFVVSKKLKPSKFKIFDREHGTVTIPHPFKSKPRYHAPWTEFAGRIMLTPTNAGTPRHELHLFHIPSGKGNFICSSAYEVDLVLSVWSFLVQYMTKDEPLPNVPDLKSYGHTTDGLGTVEEWLKISNRPGFIDPYYAWLDEVKAEPELDEVNAEIEKRVLSSR